MIESSASDKKCEGNLPSEIELDSHAYRTIDLSYTDQSIDW